MSVSLLLPMTGDNNGTVFTDYSPSPKTITSYGTAKTSTAQSKFYGSSGYFDGSSGYLTGAKSADFSFGTGDFTISLWAYPTSSSTDQFLVCLRDAANNIWDNVVSLQNMKFGWSNGVEWRLSAVPVSLNAWHHVEISRCAGVLNIFTNGQLGYSGSDSTNISQDRPLYIGRPDSVSGYYFSGHLQDVFIDKGRGLHTESFPPPGRLLGSISGTITNRLGAPCQRKVYAVSRPTDTTAPVVIAHGLSDPITGAYELIVPTSQEVTRVVVSEDSDPLLNDLVDRVIPS